MCFPVQTKCSRQFWLNCQRKVFEQFVTRKLFYLRTYKNFTIIRMFHVTLQNPSKKGCSSSIWFTFVIVEEKTFEMLKKWFRNMYQWKYRDKQKTTGVTIWLMTTQKMDVCMKFQVGFRTEMFYFDQKSINKIEWHVVNVQETNSLWKQWKAKEIMLLFFIRYKLGIDTEKVRIKTKTVNFVFF